MQPRQASGAEPFWNGTDPGQIGEFVLAGLVDRLPAATYVANPGATGKWLYASPQISDILGFDAEDFIADSGLWLRQLHPADRDRVVQSEESVQAQGRSRQ